MLIRVEEGKGRKDRYVILAPRLLSVLRAYCRVSPCRVAPPKDYLFGSWRCAIEQRSRDQTGLDT